MFYLNFNLTNFGSEPAYNAYVNFSSPNGIRLPIPLFESGSCINPDLGNIHKKVDCLIQPMLQNHSKNLKFGFNFTNIDFAGRDNFKINAYLTSHCKNRLSKPMISPQIDIRLEYDYNFITKPSAPEQYDFEDNDTNITHRFDIFNEGPSPTNEDVTFKVYVPIRDFISDVKVFLDKTTICELYGKSQPFQLSIDPYDNPIACNQDEGQKFICHVYALWEAEIFHQIEVKFKFNSTLANQDLDHTTFAIFTHLVDQHSKLDFQISLDFSVSRYCNTKNFFITFLKFSQCPRNGL